MKRVFISLSDGTTNVPIVGYTTYITTRDIGIMPMDEYIKVCDRLGIPEDERANRTSPTESLNYVVKERESTEWVSTENAKMKVRKTVKKLSRKERLLVEERYIYSTEQDDYTVVERSTIRFVIDGTDNVKVFDKDGNRLEDMEREVNVRYRQYRTGVTADGITDMATYLIRHAWGGVPLTAVRGGMWFVPSDYADALQKHRQLAMEYAKRFNPGRHKTSLHTFPAVDEEDVKAFVHENVEREIRERFKDMVDSINRRLDSLIEKGNITPERLATILERREETRLEIERFAKEYSELLGKDLNIGQMIKESTKDAAPHMESRFGLIAESVGRETAGDMYEATLKVLGISPKTAKNYRKRFTAVKVLQEVDG